MAPFVTCAALCPAAFPLLQDTVLSATVCRLTHYRLALYLDFAMEQSKISTLTSLCLLLVLTAAFFVAARTLLDKVHSSVASANATSTAVVFVSPTATAAPTLASGTGQAGEPTRAVPTDTPASTANVFVNISAGDTAPMASIPSQTQQVFCHADLATLASGSQVVFHFQKVGTPGDYYQQPEIPTTTSPYAFIYGPLQAGQWRCVVDANGQVAGTAQFAII